MKNIKLDGNSYFPQEEFVKRLKSDFPEVFTEGNKVDPDKLRTVFGENTDLGERYGLSWKGKSEVFRTIQETTTKTLKPIRDESADFDNTGNLFIEGDNLEALKILQRSYYGKVKMIYIDPPYNTGNDFVYNDKFVEDRKEYEQEAGIRDGNGDIKEINGLRKNSKDGGHFHSNWLNMMYPRLYLARNLLRQDGVIFISINDNEIHNLKLMMNEIFGEENFVECIVWNKRIPKNDKGIGTIHEYILLYAKDADTKLRFQINKEGIEEVFERVESFKQEKVLTELAEQKLRQFYAEKDFSRGITLYNNLDDNYEIWGKINLSWPNANTYGPKYKILHPITKKEVRIPERGWRWIERTFNKYYDKNKIIPLRDGSVICGRIWFDKDEKTQPSFVHFLKDLDKILLKSIVSLKSDGGIESDELLGKNIFPYPKPSKLMMGLLSSITSDDDIVLDFFAGSGTTAHAVMQLNAEDGGNRKWIMVQLPEETEEDSEARKAGYKTIADIAKERIRKAAKKIKEGDNGQLQLKNKDQDFGFKVFKVDQTNFKIWDAAVKDAEKLEKQMQEMFDTVRDDIKEEDLLFELIIKSGIEPTIFREQKEGYWKIGEGELIICLADKMSQELFNSILSEKPQKVILLDSAFTEDQLKKNLTLQSEKENVEILVA